MSEQWLGYQSPGWHTPNSMAPDWAWCDSCDTTCGKGEPCRCCLAAEVEALRAQVEVLRQRAERTLALLDSAIKYERNLGDHLTLTQISETLRGES